MPVQSRPCVRGPLKANGPARRSLSPPIPPARWANSPMPGGWRATPGSSASPGTVGKTTAKDLTAAALSQHFRTHSSPGNLNSREGLPLALLSLRRDHEVSVLEMGMDSAGEIVELCEIAQPQVGVVLNIGLTHAAKLGSMRGNCR